MSNDNAVFHLNQKYCENLARNIAVNNITTKVQRPVEQTADEREK